MLQNIGDTLKSQKWLAYVVLGILALIFAAWGAYGLVTDFTRGGSSYAAKVNGQKIGAEEVNRAWQEQQPRYAQLFGGDLPDAQRARFQEQLLDGFIRSTALIGRAQELGLRVTPEQLQRDFLSEPAFQVDGKFDRATAYARLAAAGITPAQFEAERRRSLLVNQLGIAIGSTEFLTASEAARLVALEAEQRELRYVMLTADKFASGPAFDAAAIEAAYKANEAQYMRPESARLAYAELSLADVAEQMKPTEEQVRQRYDAEKDRFEVAETRQVSHILLPLAEGKDDPAIKAQADALAERARKGEDFAKLARENSKDPGSAPQGGDLGWVDRTTFEKSLSDALFALKDGEVGGPVRSRSGWHVLKVTGIREGRTQTFEQVRPELEAELRKQMAADEFGNRQEQLQSRIERGGTSIDELVMAFGLKRGEVANFQRGTGGAPLGSDAELNAEVFSDRVARQGAIGGPRALGDDRLVIFHVEEFRPSALKPLDEVRADIVAKLTRDRGTEQARKAAADALTRLQGGEDLGKIASGLKLTADPAKFHGRSDPDVPVEVRDAAFASARPTPGKPVRKLVNLQDGAALLEVSATRVPEGQEAAVLRDQLQQREIQRRGTTDLESYVAELMRTSKIEKNLSVFQ
jgi:peptidyl-prolyl cis-trans isomerase D